jgi:microcystin-dependent protein
MSYNSGINQRVLSQILSNNYTAENQPITQTNLNVIANLQYVQNWASNILSNYLTILNPNFSGILTSSSGGNINLTGTLATPTITSNTNFLITPTINNLPVDINAIGELQISLSPIPPPNFILCDGSVVSISQYQRLYNTIGNIYGPSTATTFTLPNLTSKYPIGANGNITSLNITVPASDFNGGPLATSANFAGESNPLSPMLTKIPTHTHTITDNGHEHSVPFSVQNACMIVYEPPLGIPTLYITSGYENPYDTTTNTTNIIINTTGDQIQSIDPSSGLNGVNVSPPFVAVYFYICCK